MMKTIQMTIDETLLADVDRTVNELGTNRSFFIRSALQSALRQHSIEKLEQRHAAGYAQQPSNDAEVTEWADKQVWGELWNEERLDNLQTVQKTQIGAHITTLSSLRMQEIEQALCFALGMDRLLSLNSWR